MKLYQTTSFYGFLVITAEGNRKKDAAHLDSRSSEKEKTNRQKNWKIVELKGKNSDSIANSINLRFTADPKRIQSYLLSMPLPSTYKGKSVTIPTRFKEKSMILLLKKVTYLRSVLARESKQIWLLDKE